jgi:hypothetical protein
VRYPHSYRRHRARLTLAKADFLRALRNGQDFQSATLIMDTSNNIFVPLFVPGSGFGIPELTGYPPDPPSVAAVAHGELFRQAWGDSIVDYLVQLKRFEWDRFMSHVTDWEQNEYFEVY